MAECPQIPSLGYVNALNLSKGISKVLTLADVAWKPNDNEMKNDDFVDYDWNKWTKYNAE